MNGWIDGQMDEWMNGKMDGWMDGQMDEQMNKAALKDEASQLMRI